MKKRRHFIEITHMGDDPSVGYQLMTVYSMVRNEHCWEVVPESFMTMKLYSGDVFELKDALDTKSFARVELLDG